MGKLQSIFKRVEKKYMLTRAQYEALAAALQAQGMQADEFGKHAVCNIYYDTKDDLLIRRSLEKPVYKEKLRLRCYGTEGEEDIAFAEIKKKYKGVVYKRRITLDKQQAHRWFAEERHCPKPTQIGRELDYMMKRYDLYPRVYIGYDRLALFAPENPDLRVTFDTDIRWRVTELDLRAGDWGEPLLEEDQILMEIKIPGALPLWLCRLMQELGIRQQSFSKYGTCYQKFLRFMPQSGKETTAAGVKPSAAQTEGEAAS